MRNAPHHFLMQSVKAGTKVYVFLCMKCGNMYLCGLNASDQILSAPKSIQYFSAPKPLKTEIEMKP